jgi:hypothetical protein
MPAACASSTALQDGTAQLWQPAALAVWPWFVVAALLKLTSCSCLPAACRCRLSTVRDADAIAVVNKGKIVEQGSHDEVGGLPGLHTSTAVADSAAAMLFGGWCLFVDGAERSQVAPAWMQPAC